MSNIIESVNSNRNVPHSDLNYLVKTVAVILCSPRSGSSLLKKSLESHPDVATLGGEIEPFLVLTGNGFGFNSDCDAIDRIENKEGLVNNIFDDLSVASDALLGVDTILRKYRNRFLLQFPEIFSTDIMRENLIRVLHAALAEGKYSDVQESSVFEKFVITNIFEHEQWRINYYDGFLNSGTVRWFNEPFKIEEPPFVLPHNGRRPFRESDAENKILLFKTPPDVYRIGMYEALFPNANIKYIHLTRGYAQSVNGLMDGWLSPIGFFSHDLRRAGLDLNIQGYSDRVPFGRWWWKFDLPPNWREFLERRLEDVCLNQWISAHRSILESRVACLRVSFEDFLVSPNAVLGKIEEYLGLSARKMLKPLPHVMATDVPKLQRWKKRNDLMLSLGEQQQVGVMMESLGYEMNTETWL